MNPEKFIYIVAGVFNTVAGYLFGVAAYKLLMGTIGIWGVGVVTNILSITFAFVTYKLFVFKSSGHWLVEYFKCFMVYGALAPIGIILLWAFAVKIQISIWLAQGLVTASCIILSYLGHKKFTFAVKGK